MTTRLPQPIKGAGPKSAPKLIREHGSLDKLKVEDLRANISKDAEKVSAQEAAAAELASEDEKGEPEEEDELTPTSNVERPCSSDVEMDGNEDGEESAAKKNKSKSKTSAEGKGKEKDANSSKKKSKTTKGKVRSKRGCTDA
ncbi:hypothetical protein K435DRAFT_862803 [Dendrothele bispora CBS 962.96]|uniref:Uncharacterized protein n=1 Tax=Dendrothele bispora (strain CBS 962.96) TaxID=1314807 RepID=A0A4S8LT15_DENBC|nr:hypothetical protein K435DRAFT_862803 [Dendrothele bispora CBS 962.96]